MQNMRMENLLKKGRRHTANLDKNTNFMDYEKKEEYLWVKNERDVISGANRKGKEDHERAVGKDRRVG